MRATRGASGMRIARVLTRLGSGGTARQLLASDPRLVERGHELVLFTGPPQPGTPDLSPELRARGVEAMHVPDLERAARPVRWRAAARRLQGLLAERAPAVVHTHGPDAGRAAGRALGRPDGRANGPARVYGPRGTAGRADAPDRLPRLRAASEARLLSSADRVVVECHAAAEELLQLGTVREERLVVVPPGAELNELLRLEPRAPDRPGPLRRRNGVDGKAFLVGVMGPLTPAARPALALESFDLLAARHPELQLVYLGDGPERGRLQRLAAERGGRVHLLDAPVDESGPAPADVCSILGDLDAVFHAAGEVGLSVALIEAAAAARPIVAADVGGASELVVHERTGFLGADAAELAAGLDQLVRDPRAALAMGQRSRLRAAERHSAGRLTERLEALYETVGEARACAS